jgi:hypothetical protein
MQCVTAGKEGGGAGGLFEDAATGTLSVDHVPPHGKDERLGGG